MSMTGETVRRSAGRGFGRAGLVLLMALAAAPLAGCASSDNDDLVEQSTPDQLYNQGLASINAGKFSDALTKFEEVDRVHPYSDWARKSILMQAYINFERGNYTEAATAGRRFVTNFPAHEDAPYAAYIVAESTFRQIPDVSRDQEQTQRALSAFNDIITRYPNSQYAEEAKKKITIARDQLAGKEMQVGRYYLERRQYLAAVNRFRVVIGQYQRTRHVEEALARVAEAYMSLGVVNEAQTAGAVLGHNFPDSAWYRDTFKLLQSGGLEPREDTGSWISRAFKDFRVL